MTVTWDYTGEEIQPAAILKVMLTLTIDENTADLTVVSFDIQITGRTVGGNSNNNGKGKK